MVKKIFILLVIIPLALYSEDIFDKKCVPCHKELPTSLQQMFMQYLKLYSSEKNVKYVMKYYLKHPSKELSAMSDLFIDVYGIKNPTKLTDKELNEAIDIYWDRYKVIGNLK
jgi:hypothetical protein